MNPIFYGSMLLVAGGIGALEVLNAIRRSPVGGLAWLGLVFMLDALIAAGAFWILDQAIVPTFWGQPITVYVAAVVAGPVLFRVAVSFVWPEGVRSHEIFWGKLSQLRQFFISQVDKGAAIQHSAWLNTRVIPSLCLLGVQTLRDRSYTYLVEVNELSDEKRAQIIDDIDTIADDVTTPETARIKSIAHVVSKHIGRRFLKGLVSEQKKATAVALSTVDAART